MLLNCRLYLQFNSQTYMNSNCEADVHLTNCAVAQRCMISKTMLLPQVRRKYKFSTRNDWTSVAFHFFLLHTYTLCGLMRLKVFYLIPASISPPISYTVERGESTSRKNQVHRECNRLQPAASNTEPWIHAQLVDWFSYCFQGVVILKYALVRHSLV